MHAGLGVGVGWRGQVWAYMSKGGLVRMGQTDWAGMDGVGGFGYACRSRGGCGWVHRLVTPTSIYTISYRGDHSHGFLKAYIVREWRKFNCSIH